VVTRALTASSSASAASPAISARISGGTTFTSRVTLRTIGDSREGALCVGAGLAAPP
jgi:hypothetical protein